MEEICGHNRKIFYASQTLSFQRILDFDFEIEIFLYGSNNVWARATR